MVSSKTGENLGDLILQNEIEKKFNGQMEKCHQFLVQFKSTLKGIEKPKHNISKKNDQAPLLNPGNDSKVTTLPQLLLTSVESCFDTQANLLEIPYDLKIAQCYIGMHSMQQMELIQERQKETSQD